ncbi:MAG: DUF3574 domain-containing protein [Chitinophagaceae bacterium]
MRYKFLLLCIILSSCNSSRMVETSLYFGQYKPGGGMVSATEWENFKKDYVRKVFKEGSTVINVSGDWYDTAARKLITGPTFVVIYYYKNSPVVSKQIDSLRQWYKVLFRQQSVLRVDKKVAASF